MTFEFLYIYKYMITIKKKHNIILNKNFINHNSVLYLWTTSPKLLEGLAVMKAWGIYI
jgi:N6-adenosine-specific RNA methylase IME4